MWWPFINGWMLLWGLAAAVPIIIHLWNKRQYHEVPWAAMRYLMDALRKNSRRIQVEQWILLAVRTLILLLLAAALANPISSLVSGLRSDPASSGQTHWILVLDGSYSMSYQQQGRSRFDRAREAAISIVRQATQGDGYSLVLMGMPPQIIVGEVAFDPDDVIEEIQNAAPLDSGASLVATLSELRRLAKDGSAQYPRLQHTKICFLTDLGRTTWDELTTREVRTQLGQLADVASLVLLDVGQEDVQNLALTHLGLRESLVTITTPATVDAELHNFGPQPQQGVGLDLVVDGQPVASQQIARIDPDARASVSFVHRFETPGDHVLEVRLAEDPLPVDNRRWATTQVREAVDVLCVRGKAGAAQHVALALAPTPGLALVRPEVVAESAILERDLRQYDALFLCNVGRFGPDEASVLYNYVRSGGGLVFFLGDQVQPENYNQQLGGELGKNRLLPAQLGQVVSESQYEFDALEYRHRLVAPFRGYQRSGLLTTPISKYILLEPHEPEAQVALAFSSGDPAIVEQQIGRGRVILVATAASAAGDNRFGSQSSWGDFAAWPSFVPLVQEMLALALSGTTESRNVEVGDVLEGFLSSAAAGNAVQVVSPRDPSLEEAQRIPVTRDADLGHWAYQETLWSGIYRVYQQQDDQAPQLFAVNVDTRESDLSRFDAQLLPSQFQREVAAEDPLAAGLEIAVSSQMFRVLLALVLVLVLLETFLAWRFGRSTA